MKQYARLRHEIPSNLHRIALTALDIRQRVQISCDKSSRSGEELYGGDPVLTPAKSHGPELDKQADLLKPGVKRCAQAIAQFRPNPALTSSSRVLLFIALTKLDKTNGMFSFVEVPEDSAIPRNEWKEEEVVIEPGEGIVWRGDCARKAGVGDGGVMLIVRYD